MKFYLVSTCLNEGLKYNLFPRFFVLLLDSNYIEIRGRLWAWLRCWCHAKSVSRRWSFSSMTTCTTTCSSWWSATWGSSIWRGECNYSALEKPWVLWLWLDLRVEFPASWSDLWLAGHEAGLYSHSCLTSNLCQFYSDCPTNSMAWDQWGSREFQRMIPEIQRMSPERMSREIQWTEPRVPEGVPKVHNGKFWLWWIWWKSLAGGEVSICRMWDRLA